MGEQFAHGSVPVSVVARVYGKDASWVRAGIISGWLPIGKATRNGELVTKIENINSKYGRINFYISPKLLLEETGYLGNCETKNKSRTKIVNSVKKLKTFVERKTGTQKQALEARAKKQAIKKSYATSGLRERINWCA